MNGYIVCGDSRESIPRDPVELVITSPPYGVGIDYDVADDSMTRDEWRDLMQQVLGAAYQRLVSGGRICVNVHHDAGRDNAFPTGMVIQQILDGLPGALNRGTIVWDKSAAAGVSTAWGSWLSPANPTLRGVYESIYVYSKYELSRYPASGVESDITKKEFLAATADVWRDIGTVSQLQTGHPAAFPVRLAQRLIQLYSWPGDTVLDPFFGSGTVGLAAEELGRRWIGVELSEDYCELAARRIAPFDGMEPEIRHWLGDGLEAVRGVV